MDACELKGGYEPLGNKCAINCDLLKAAPTLILKCCEYTPKINSKDGVGFGFL